MKEDVTKTVMKYKKKIEDADKQENIMSGELLSMNEQLRNLLGCDDIKEIKTKLNKAEENYKSLQEKLDILVEKLQAIPELNDEDYY